MSVEIDPKKNVHGKNLVDYTAKTKGDVRNTFDSLVREYEAFRSRFDAIHDMQENTIRAAVDALNAYRKVSVPVFDKLDNAGQKNLGFTIMEEFFYLLFEKMMRLSGVGAKNMFIGKGNSYVSLSFTPSSFNTLFKQPGAYIHTKDQDFVLGAEVDISVTADETSQSMSTVIPAVAIECKTFLERNMLDSCAATARRLKNAMPYCVYIVAAEYMKMSDASPELTDIDEVYVLCRKKNSEREARKKQGLPPFDIDAELILDLYRRVVRHINAIWWNPADAVETGKIINRPI